MRVRRIGWERFVTKFKPVKNTATFDAAFDGYMFDTFGKEMKAFDKLVEHAAKLGNPAYHVWTIVDGEGRKVWLCNGWHIANRLGYMFTEETWEEDDEYNILI